MTSPTTKEMINQETKENTLNFDLTTQHNDNLLRNLSGFNLEVDTMPRDGNCLFRSLVRQLYRYLQNNQDNNNDEVK